MNANELTEKICTWARTKLASKAKSPTVRFMIGAMTVGTGRSAIENKVVAVARMIGEESDAIDLAKLKESVMGGFSVEHSVPVLGGLMSLDKSDADEFFSGLGV